MAHNMVRMPICVCVFLILKRVETGYCCTIKLSVALSSSPYARSLVTNEEFLPGVVRKKDWKSKFFRFVASVNIDEYDGKKNSQRIRSNLGEMSKKNDEDKNTISIKQISEMIFRKQEKRYFWVNYCGI